MGPKAPKAQPVPTPAPPQIEDTDKVAQDALDLMLKRRGRASTRGTGPGGAQFNAPAAATSPSKLLGVG